MYAVSGPAGSVKFVEHVHMPAGVLTDAGRTLARLLFLACGLSYYKTASPGVMRVRDGLTDSEHQFLTTLVENGMGEFAYRNRLPHSTHPVIDADRLDGPPAGAVEIRLLDGAPLVPVGGGKDSVVTLESLKRIGCDVVAFSVNRFAPIDACIAASGVRSVHAMRSIDAGLATLNRVGAYNGHVPVTAINSVIALLVADLLELGPVVMSNERSANYGSLRWNGLDVNHQWSKSMAFETLLRDTIHAAGLLPDRYFSLLRPLSELAIAQRFSRLSGYFGIFNSCNRAFTIDPSTRRTWCGECPKCRFVFLILAPFLPPSALTRIFGRNLLDETANLGPYREILGLAAHKPFECVGDYDEAALAVKMASESAEWAATGLVPALLCAIDAGGHTPDGDRDRQLLGTSGSHWVPSDFQEALDVLS